VAGVEPRLARWALVCTGDADRADELAQRVRLRLHRSLGGFRGESRFETWLYRITANEAVSMARERGREPVALDEVDGRLEALRAQERDGIDRLYAGRVAALVRRFFAELPARQREVFSLVDLEGREAGEVAEMLGLSPVTVRVHLLRARRAVRARILDLHPELEEGYGRGM